MVEKIFDLEERTTNFGKKVVKLAKKIPVNSISTPIITQFVKAGTSVGANYCEANGAESGKDFFHKIGISKKEAKESKYWLEIILELIPELKPEVSELKKEAHELLLILSSIINKKKSK